MFNKTLARGAVQLQSLVAVFISPVYACEILYQSSTLGQTGVTSEQQMTENIPGTNVSSTVFVGVHFQLTQPASITGVGGHFSAGDSGGTFFGAIVALTGKSDFPDTTDLSSPDVLGVTLLEFPYPSAEVYGDLELALEPGWYGVVFGSGAFGATGSGGAIKNNSDVDSPSYFGWQASLPWGSRSATAKGQRLVVLGGTIPEPTSTCSLAVLTLQLGLWYHLRAV